MSLKEGNIHPTSMLIRPAAGWVTLNLVELWEYRELLYFLTWRDIKVRYKQTALGAAWAVIQPLGMMLVFTIFFGRLIGVPSDGLLNYYYSHHSIYAVLSHHSIPRSLVHA